MSRSEADLQRDAAVAVFHGIVGGDAARMAGVLNASRDEINWKHLAAYLCGCGFARMVAAAEFSRPLRAVAPPEFLATMQIRARADALRELSHRETLERIHSVLVSAGKRAILLKGAALYLLEQGRGVVPGRIPGDIDLWMESLNDALWLRRHLLENGFGGKADAPLNAPHHLAGIAFRQSAVEIHFAPMPAFWNLPEADMADRAMALADWPGFSVLSPADMVLHEAVHCTSHLWSFGLKLAFDFLRIDGLAGRIDWSDLEPLARRTQYPAAFWGPVGALREDLPAGSLPLLADLDEVMPGEERIRMAVRLARRRMFTECGNADELNPVLRNMMFMKIMPWRRRVAYVRYLLGDAAAESRRVALRGSGGQSWRRLPGHLADSVRHWRKMR